jgi:thiamine phosphate synthase YjbQ (UPF0047 family)
MKSYRQELWFEIPSRRDFVNITLHVQKCVEERTVTEGLALMAKQIKLTTFNSKSHPTYPAEFIT